MEQRVSEIEIEARPGKKIHLCASAGASVYPHDGTTYETLLADADHRMYRDKAARRGKLAVARANQPAGEFMVTEVFDTASTTFDPVRPPSRATT